MSGSRFVPFAPPRLPRRRRRMQGSAPPRKGMPLSRPVAPCILQGSVMERGHRGAPLRPHG